MARTRSHAVAAAVVLALGCGSGRSGSTGPASPGGSPSGGSPGAGTPDGAGGGGQPAGAPGESGGGAGATPAAGGGGAPAASPPAAPGGFPILLDAPVLAMAVSPEGELLLASAPFAAAPALRLRRYRADGSVSWETRWPGFANRHVHGRGLAFAPDGGAFVAFEAGWCGGAASGCGTVQAADAAIPGAAVVRVAADGAVSWWRDLGQASGDAFPLAAAPDGRVAYVAGSHAHVLAPDGRELLDSFDSGCQPAFDAAGALYLVRLRSGRYELAKLDTTFATVWAVPIPAAGLDQAITVAPEGSVAVADVRDLQVREASDGTLRWSAIMPVSGFYRPPAMTAAPDGRLYAAGQDVSSDALGLVLYARDGTLVGTRAIDAPWTQAPAAHAIDVAPDGTLRVAGEFASAFDFGSGRAAPSPVGGFVLQVGADLASPLGAAVPGAGPAAPRFATAIAERRGLTVAGRSDGGAFVAVGHGDAGTIGSLELRRVDAAGSVVWSRSFGEWFEQGVDALAATPDGGVLVAVRMICGIQKGSCFSHRVDLGGGSGANDFLAKLGADGTFEWHAALDPTARGFALAVGPDGRIAVVGSALRVLDAAGQTLWSAPATGVPAFGPDGALYAGRSERVADPGSGGPFLVRWSASGEEEWKVAAAAWDPALTFAAGAVVLRGAEYGPDTPVVAAYDPATGVERWRLGNASLDVEASSVVAGPGGEVLVVGRRPAPCHELALSAFGADGSWLRSRNLERHPLCLGPPMLATASTAGGAVLVAGALWTAADFGTGLVDAAELLLSVSP